jgi:rhamnosyl/mannosyltransferase
LNKIRVLQVNKFYPPWVGGVEVVVQNIAEGLSGKTDMKVLVCQPGGKGENDSYKGVPIIRSSSFGIFFSMPISIRFISDLRSLVKNADIVHFHNPFPLGDLACLLSGYKGKVAVWWHSDIVSQRILAKFVRPISKAFLKRADLIIVATQNHIESSNILKPFASKCKVIPFGLKFGEYERVQINNFLTDKLNVRENKKLLFVGRSVYYKGIDVLINAMRKAHNVELFIVGTGIMENEYKRIAESLALMDIVHFLGYLPFGELKSAYADCDIFVFPSIANIEAFGIAQIEAMFYGKPVINTALPTGVSAVSVHGETGLTVPVGDVDGLASAIQQLVDNEALRKTFGANAAAKVRRCYDEEQMLGSLYEEYQKLMGE